MIFNYKIPICKIRGAVSILIVTLLFSFFSCAGRETHPVTRSSTDKAITVRMVPSIRVLIKRDLKKLSIGDGDYYVRTKRGEIISRGEESIIVHSDGGYLVVGDKKFKDELIVVSRVPASIDGALYSGKVVLYPTEKGIDLIDLIDLERYVASVLKSEIPPSFTYEAKKAMAVAIRSYSLYRMGRGKNGYYHLDSTNLSQVYGGIDRVGGEYTKAVDETRGTVVTYEGEPALSVYHSTCGGHTENAYDAWQRDIPYLRTISCAFCIDSPSYRWVYKIRREDFLEVLKGVDVAGEDLLSIRTGMLTSTGRVKTLQVTTEKNTWNFDSFQLRAFLGYSAIKSLEFTIELEEDMILIGGRGYGHGVGLCQYGANKLSVMGYDYIDILKFYYGNTIEFNKFY